MSDQNSTTPDPNDAVPGYTPPSSSEPAAAEPPAYTPPSASEPPSYSAPAAEPPSYSAPAAPEPPSYAAPATGGYEPPAAGGYTPPPAQPGFPEPPGPGAYPPPPAAPYAGGFTDPGAYPATGGYPGTPVPSAGGAALADWPKRALGGLIDYVAAGIVISVVGSLLSNVSSTLGTLANIILSIGWMCYLGYKSGTTGVTFGRSINKTKLVSAETGQPIGVTNGIIRQLAHIVDSIICYIGWLFPLWDAQKQTLADKIMKTVVIDNSADPNASTYNWG